MGGESGSEGVLVVIYEAFLDGSSLVNGVLSPLDRLISGHCSITWGLFLLKKASLTLVSAFCYSQGCGAARVEKSD